MNKILLRGTVASKIKFSHSSHGENFYEFRLKSRKKKQKRGCDNLLGSGNYSGKVFNQRTRKD